MPIRSWSVISKHSNNIHKMHLVEDLNLKNLYVWNRLDEFSPFKKPQWSRNWCRVGCWGNHPSPSSQYEPTFPRQFLSTHMDRSWTTAHVCFPESYMDAAVRKIFKQTSSNISPSAPPAVADRNFPFPQMPLDSQLAPPVTASSTWGAGSHQQSSRIETEKMWGKHGLIQKPFWNHVSIFVAILNIALTLLGP